MTNENTQMEEEGFATEAATKIGPRYKVFRFKGELKPGESRTFTMALFSAYKNLAKIADPERRKNAWRFPVAKHWGFKILSDGKPRNFVFACPGRYGKGDKVYKACPVCELLNPVINKVTKIYDQKVALLEESLGKKEARDKVKGEMKSKLEFKERFNRDYRPVLLAVSDENGEPTVFEATSQAVAVIIEHIASQAPSEGKSTYERYLAPNGAVYIQVTQYRTADKGAYAWKVSDVMESVPGTNYKAPKQRKMSPEQIKHALDALPSLDTVVPVLPEAMLAEMGKMTLDQVQDDALFTEMYERHVGGKTHRHEEADADEEEAAPPPPKKAAPAPAPAPAPKAKTEPAGFAEAPSQPEVKELDLEDDDLPF